MSKTSPIPVASVHATIPSGSKIPLSHALWQIRHRDEALSLEDSEHRIGRELVRDLSYVPAQLDHAGCYYRLQIPASFPLTPDADGVLQAPSSIAESSDGITWTPLTPYNDFIPIPASLAIDPDRMVVPFTDKLLFTLAGNGATEIVNPVLPMPARLFLYLKNLISMAGVIEILITGQAYPPVPWRGGNIKTEVVAFNDAGFASSDTIWSSITSLTVHSLPAGAVLEGAIFQSLFRHDIDDRPFIHPEFRGQEFPRYWSIDHGLLEESYVLNRFAGHSSISTWSTPVPLTAIAVEPETYGLYAAGGTSLYYSNRREVTGNMAGTGIHTEPPYGLTVYYDTGKRSDNIGRGGSPDSRYLYIGMRPYGSAASLSQYRVVVKRPDGILYGLTSAGLSTYSSYAGWQQGTPAPLSLLLDQTGTYTVTLEQTDVNGNPTRDIAVYQNQALTPLATFDMSRLVPAVVAIGFDSRNRMWVWTGSFLVPIKIVYKGYIFDPASKSLYLTDTYPQIRLT